jgi:hypothetical protein
MLCSKGTTKPPTPLLVHAPQPQNSKNNTQDDCLHTVKYYTAAGKHTNSNGMHTTAKCRAARLLKAMTHNAGLLQTPSHRPVWCAHQPQPPPEHGNPPHRHKQGLLPPCAPRCVALTGGRIIHMAVCCVVHLKECCWTGSRKLRAAEGCCSSCCICLLADPLHASSAHVTAPGDAEHCPAPACSSSSARRTIATPINVQAMLCGRPMVAPQRQLPFQDTSQRTMVRIGLLLPPNLPVSTGAGFRGCHC